MRRTLSLISVCLLAAVLLPGPAAGVTDRWAAWSPVAGSANDYRGSLTQRANGFPGAIWTSDSRSNVQLPSGASAFLGAATPPGAAYGSSRGNPYLVLRPRADTASTPSTTTYSFDHPTPDTGWAFVLGDVDADQVQVSATGADGVEVPPAEVDSWFSGSFNYAGGSDEPIWRPASSTLVGNPDARDTDGAGGWFEPDVRLTSLTFTFTRRAGFPVYQTWFVSRARPVGGTVTDVSETGGCPLQLATATLVSPYGEELAAAPVGADGTYDLGEVATQSGYVVRLDVPETCAVRGPVEREVSTRGEDGSPGSRADFEVRAVVPRAVSGTVRDEDGMPVASVEITLTRPDGTTATTTTAADGTYLIDANPSGTGYTLTLTVPDGYAAGPGGTTRTLDVAGVPVTGQDFVVDALATVSGRVTGGGSGLGGVAVELTPAGGGPALTTVTTGDGGYVLDAVPPGDYTLAVTAPPGYDAPPPQDVRVPDAGLTEQDVDLTRPGAVGGQVVLDGEPRPGVRVVVDGPGGSRVLTTDGAGRYFLDDLDPGTYTITVTAPDGTDVEGDRSRTVTLTEAGEVLGSEDFRLVKEPGTPTASPSPTDPPTSSPTGSPTGSPTQGPTSSSPTGSTDDGGTLPDTGGPPLGLVALGAASLVAGLVMLVASRRRPRGLRSR